MENIILEKVKALAKEATALKENNASMVLRALAGAMYGEVDDMLADKIQGYVKDVLLPLVKQKRLISRASRN